MVKITLAFLLIFSAVDILGTPIASPSEIRTVNWSDISNKDISPSGKAALSFEAGLWKHAETEHFVYHFTDEKEAETVYVHAETYYKWIKDFFGVAKDEWSKKSHIFVFTNEGDWNAFLSRLKHDGKPPAFTNGWELFIFRAPHWASPRKSLAHEMTHVIMFRFLNGPIPKLLDEGFAEYASYRIVQMQMEHSGYGMYPVQPVREADYRPLEEVMNMNDYPEDNLEAFYNEGELFIRFLSENYGNEKLFEFLRSASEGAGLKKLLKDIYDIDVETLEGKFKGYAIR